MDPKYYTKFHTGADGRKYRPYFIGPFWPCLGVQQEKSQNKSQIKYSFISSNTARGICQK